MGLRNVVAVAVALMLVVVSPEQNVAAEDDGSPRNEAEISQTDHPEDGGLTMALVGIVIGAVLTWAATGGKDVVAGPVTIGVDASHFHVSDTRNVVVDVPYSNGNINSWDRGGAVITYVRIDGEEVLKDFHTLTERETAIKRVTMPFQGAKAATATIAVEAYVWGQDHGLVFDSNVHRTTSGTLPVGVQGPVGPLTLTPAAGQVFQHAAGTIHSLSIENHAAKMGWVRGSNINGVTVPVTTMLAGQDHGPSTTTTLHAGAVNHTGTHSTSTIPVPFAWGASEITVPLAKSIWKQPLSLNNGTDYCVLEGKAGGPGRKTSRATAGPVDVSSGCFTPGFVQLSDVGHSFGLSGITVSLVNHPGVGPVHDLVSDVTGQFCWSSLPLAEEVDIYINWDGNVPEIAQQTYEAVPLEILEGGAPTLEINYVEWLVPPIEGTLVASDGGELTATVYSLRPGYPDHPIGIVTDGAFSLGGAHMLEFNSYSSELVFVPEPPFNRTLAPETPIVVPFDPTFVSSDVVDIGTVSFTIAPRETAPMITVRGTFFDETMTPVPVLELEFRQGLSLVASATTNVSGFFEVAVPNGVATVSAPNLEVLGLEPLPSQDVDFGLNGSTVLDFGNRMLFFDPLLFADGFEGGDSDEWSSTTP